MVMFFGDAAKTSGAAKDIKVMPCEFFAELARRWEERHPNGHVLPQAAVDPPPDMSRGAVFIFYAFEDEAAVKMLKSGLEAHGCEVWYDREQSKSGMTFHYQLEEAVKQHCSLFVSVIWRNTQAQSEAYFHRERNWPRKKPSVIQTCFGPSSIILW